MTNWPEGAAEGKTTTMAKGTVKWFNTQKGYGFIQPEAGGPDVFVHITAVQRAGLRELREGDKLSYELITDRRTGKTSAGELQLAGQ
jgi:CspA family cold shock protein